MLDIVDAQLHLGRGMIDATLETMDALGITSVLLDEFWGSWPDTHPTHIQPGYLLPNGAWRAVWPTAEEASLLHPGRFSHVARIDPRDPQLESVMRCVGSSPHARGFRLQPVWTLEEADAFANGSFDPLLDIAQDIGKPVFLFIPGYVEALERYLRKFPRLTFVIDHCGMGFPNIPPGRPEAQAAHTLTPAYFDDVCRIAEYPNVAMKWSHTQDRFGVTAYPYEPIRPLLRKAINAFGVNRLMWAGDKTVMFGHNWSDLLHGIKDDPELSLEEKQWILGRTARTILDWPAPPPAPPAYPGL